MTPPDSFVAIGQAHFSFSPAFQLPLGWAFEASLQKKGASQPADPLAIRSRDYAELAAINHGDMWIVARNGSLNSNLAARMPNTTNTAFTKPV